jgi:hypothetical protein
MGKSDGPLAQGHSYKIPTATSLLDYSVGRHNTGQSRASVEGNCVEVMLGCRSILEMKNCTTQVAICDTKIKIKTRIPLVCCKKIHLSRQRICGHKNIRMKIKRFLTQLVLKQERRRSHT